jgi:hypothetical protein
VPAEDDETCSGVTTHSGRFGRAPSCIIEELGASALGLAKAE